MKAIWARVYFVYPLAIPVAIWLVSLAGQWLAAAFPAFVLFEAEAQRITVSMTSAEIVGGVIAGSMLIGGVYTKWGKK